jgi:hypothetical protein
VTCVALLTGSQTSGWSRRPVNQGGRVPAPAIEAGAAKAASAASDGQATLFTSVRPERVTADSEFTTVEHAAKLSKALIDQL